MIYSKKDINLEHIYEGYNNLRLIIDILLERYNVRYEESQDAPSTYATMRQERDNRGYFVVYNGGDHGMLNREYNIRFRALHDAMHYKYNLSFSYDDERKLSDITAIEAFLVAYNELGLTTWESFVVREIVTAEIRGQIDYYQANKKYVKDQTQFILNYFNVSLDAVC